MIMESPELNTLFAHCPKCSGKMQNSYKFIPNKLFCSSCRFEAYPSQLAFEKPEKIPCGKIRIISDIKNGIRQTQTGKDEHDVLWVRSRPLGKIKNRVEHSDLIGDGLRQHFTHDEYPFSDWLIKTQCED